MIAWTERLEGRNGPRGPVAELTLTDRTGGSSVGPYGTATGSDGLNLGVHVGDDLDRVTANRAALASALGLAVERLVVANQVHGVTVAHVSDPWPTRPQDADAMVTTVPDLALAVLVADCVPVLLAAPDEGVVAVAHAGRPGMAAGVVPATVGAMRDLGGRRIVARLGPSVCGRCYEVPLELREQVAAVQPVSRTLTWAGTPALDVAAGVLSQLVELGVAVQQLPGCTRESANLYSYRRDGRTGRFAGVARLRPAEVGA
ncbi:peptidoglycan editing factor PgeF [Angustibacter sp. McL0619]|uniref:peptidoglycan editing factor PgeF n=1 Tax=Angustibacter sp. McL0619 TaxID=3415676 RepID=UPI003CEE3771